MVSKVINLQYQRYPGTANAGPVSTVAVPSYLSQSYGRDNASLVPQSLRFGDMDDNSGDDFGNIPGMRPVFAAEMPKTPQMVSEVYNNNFDGMKTVIMEKLSQASTPVYANDPIAQTRLLVGAYRDVQSFIDSIEKDSGGKPSPQMQSLIQQLKSLQSTVLGRIKAATGANVSEDELKALLDNDPKTGKDGQPKANVPNLADPKTKALLGSAGQKLAKQVQGLSQKASQMISQAEANPDKAQDLVSGAMALLRQGLQITMLGGALDAMGNTQGQEGSANYGQEKQNLMTLIQRATQFSKSHGLKAEEMITTTEFANPQPA